MNQGPSGPFFWLEWGLFILFRKTLFLLFQMFQSIKSGFNAIRRQFFAYTYLKQKKWRCFKCGFVKQNKRPKQVGVSKIFHHKILMDNTLSG